MEEKLQAENKLKENKNSFEVYDIKFLIGILVTVLPFWGYLIAYAYELGYSSYFGIPSSFITIKLENILSIVFGLVTLSVTIYFNLNITFPMFNYLYSKNILTKFILVVGGIFLLLGVSIIISKVDIITWILWGMLFFLFFILPLLSPIFRKNKSISYLKQFELEYEKNSEEKNLTNNLVRLFSKKNVVIVYIIWVSIITSSLVGDINAKNQKQFRLINNNKNLIVLSIYDENIICTTYLNIRNRIKNNFIILNKTKLDSFVLSTFLPFEELKTNQKEKTEDIDSIKLNF